MKLKRGETAVFQAPDDAVALRIAGAGKLVKVDVVEGLAVVTAAVTATMPPGRYGSEWEVVDADGRVTLPDGPMLLLAPSLSTDETRDSPTTPNERALEAARAALETAAGSADIGFAVEGASFTFESRGELLTFVRQLELRVAHERGLTKRKMEFKL